jgi:hypothetical protein
MEWRTNTYKEVPNRKRNHRGEYRDREYEDSELKEERDKVTKDYKLLAKRLQYEKPSYIDLTDRVAKRIAKDILYHETIMKHFMDQPAYQFIMNVASFTNDDVSKFWSDHIKTNKPAPYELGNDIREMAVRIARERADQDVHQWCQFNDGLFKVEYSDGDTPTTESPSTPGVQDEYFDGGTPTTETPSTPGVQDEYSDGGTPTTETSERKRDNESQYIFGGVQDESSDGGTPTTETSERKRDNESQPSTPSGGTSPIYIQTPYRKLPTRKIKYITEYRTKINFEDIKNEEDFKNWLGTKYYDSLGTPLNIQSDDKPPSEEQDSLKYRIANQEGTKDYYYDFRGLRFTGAPIGSRSARFKDPDDRWCHEDPCGYKYIELVEPYYKRRFDFHIHDYLKNHYEEKMAYEIQKWYNSSPASIKKIFFAPVIYGHMNEVTFALNHRYPKFRNCTAEDFYSSRGHAVLFAKCVALAIRGSQVLSGKKYGLDKSFMRINLEKRRAMYAWKHIDVPPSTKVRAKNTDTSAKVGNNPSSSSDPTVRTLFKGYSNGVPNNLAMFKPS